MGVRLGSKSCIEKTAKFVSEKFRISLGRGREPSNLRCSGLAVAHNRRRFRSDAAPILVPQVLGHQTRCHGKYEYDHLRHQSLRGSRGPVPGRAQPSPSRPQIRLIQLGGVGRYPCGSATGSRRLAPAWLSAGQRETQRMRPEGQRPSQMPRSDPTLRTRPRIPEPLPAESSRKRAIRRRTAARRRNSQEEARSAS